METAIGVFDSRDQAEKAVKELRVRGVPDNSIVFMSRSQTDANSIAKEFGAYIGGSVGGAPEMTAGAATVSLLLPKLGPIFALGFGAAALLGVAGASAGAKAGEASDDEDAPAAANAESFGDVAFFRHALAEWRSLIVVRSQSPEISKLACEVLDRLGMGLPDRSSQVKMQTTTRQVGDVTVVDISGRITHSEGNAMLREIVREMAARGNKMLVLNLREVHYLDSSGVSELVRTHTTVKNMDGQLRLVSLSKRVSDLLQMTKLESVFDIEKNEDSAIRSLHGDGPNLAVA